MIQQNDLIKKEKGKKEKYVKGMKGAQSDFVLYGKDAKAVMYATATKMAKDFRRKENGYINKCRHG